MLKNTVRTIICTLTLFVVVPMASAASKMPTTPEDHFALAKQYQEQTVAHRKEAADHREMAEKYKTVVNAHEKRGQKNPFEVKMEKHCVAIATAADKLAVESEKAADYHTLRGKELQGK